MARKPKSEAAPETTVKAIKGFGPDSKMPSGLGKTAPDPPRNRNPHR